MTWIEWMLIVVGLFVFVARLARLAKGTADSLVTIEGKLESIERRFDSLESDVNRIRETVAPDADD